MSRFLQLSQYWLRSFLIAIALTTSISFMPIASAKLFDGPFYNLPPLERDSLRQGKVILNGEKGKYTARILVTGSVTTAWAVLTDYDNFEQFLPNVDNSQLLETNGNRKVFEQINRIRAFIFNKKSRVRLAVTETYPQQIAFSVVDGDLKSLNGVWQLEPISPYPSAPPNQVLITHEVNVEPNGSTGGLFYGIYEDALQDTLVAIKQEVEERSVPNK
jgi:ribosome-associated toxin RatA of RatAB toxin-antitoxin module